jgi:membrane protein implicated in regulation of membrane protease activity
VKEFVIYTALRIALFLGSFAIVFGIWAAVTGDVPVFWAVLIAFVVSGVGSYYLLERQREAFARRVDARAQKATEKLDEMRSKEDTD